MANYTKYCEICKCDSDHYASEHLPTDRPRNPLASELPTDDLSNPKDRLGDTKPQLHLVPPSAVIHMASAMQYGAEKYGPYNWRDKKVRATVYIAAALRHLNSYLDGEDYAPDSGVHHLAHAAAGIGILLDAKETGCLIDDRPPKGKAAELIGRLTKQKKLDI